IAVSPNVAASGGDGLDDRSSVTEVAAVEDHERELAEAKASFEQILAAKTAAVSRLHREVDQWKARASIVPGLATSTEGTTAHGQLLYREQLLKKEGEIAGLKREIEVLERSTAELKQKVATLESARATLEQTARDLSERAAHFEKLFSAARPDRDQAVKRADDLARRFERVRPDMEGAEQEVAGEKHARESEVAAYAQTIAELSKKHDLAKAKVAAVERMLADKIGVELAAARAEHVDALATAEQGFQHRLAVLRHEHEGAIAKLKAAARARIGQANDRVAEGARDAREKLAEANQRLADADREATNRIQGFEALVASRAEDIERLERELEGLRAEIPALEAENAALRVELTSLRLRLDHDADEEPSAAARSK